MKVKILVLLGALIIVCGIVLHFWGRWFGRETRCPDQDGMVYVPSGPFWFRYEGERWKAEGRSDELVELEAFCIDRFEYPNIWLRKPHVEMSWHKARALCAQKQKRLCTGYEWQKAFGGPDGLRYSYGNRFDPNRCNTYYKVGKHEVARRLARSGIFIRCTSPYGVYDMSGNVSEWTDEMWQDGFDEVVLRGGSFNVNLATSQYLQQNGIWHFRGYSESIGSIHHHHPLLPKDDDGFRCCAEPIKD